MKPIIADNYDAMSKQVARDIIEIMTSIDSPLFCPASGDTTKGLYKQMAVLHQQGQLNTANWLFVGLDEWMGMNENDEGSCRFHLDEQLFEPLQVNNDRICFFDGKAADPVAECDRVEEFIQQQAGIDLLILGLGLNGHVGMNEPGISTSLRSHVATLDPLTAQVGQKYFDKPQQLTEGLTLGIATMLAAKNIFLLVSGSRKAAIVKKVIEGEITAAVPATLLRQHPGLKIYLDKDAAGMLQE